MSESANVTPGVNATSEQYNDLRTDAITRYVRYYLEIKGSLSIGDDQQVVTVPATMTVTKIKHRVESGSCTIRIQNDAADIKASISVTTSYASETSGFTNESLVEGDELRLDVQTTSSGSDLHVVVYATETI